MSAPALRPVITLLTDFGEGSYVASMKGVLLSFTPDATIVDITHHVPPGAVGSAGFLLRHTAEHFPAGTVHICVVDPGVGTERLPLIVEANGTVFVGPDNGIFHEVIRAADDARAYRINEGAWLPGKICPTFHGRDLFAPVAGRLAGGDSPARLGSPVELDRLVPSPLRAPRKERETFSGEVVWVDQFGNLITNLEKGAIEEWSNGRAHRLIAGSESIGAPITTFQDGERGRPASLYGSWETLEIVIPEGNAAEQLGMKAGETIRLEIAHGK